MTYNVFGGTLNLARLNYVSRAIKYYISITKLFKLQNIANCGYCYNAGNNYVYNALAVMTYEYRMLKRCFLLPYYCCYTQYVFV